MATARFLDRIVFKNTAKSPLGRIVLAGFLQNHTGVVEKPMRVLGHYALVYLLRGKGTFSDAAGASRKLQPGDFFLVSPDVPHWYGPTRGSTWDEFYIVFSGPVFDLWRKKGLFNLGQRPCHLEPVSYWRRRLEEVVVAEADSLRQISSLQHLLAEILEAADSSRKPQWLAQACHLLEREAASPQKAARELGMSYDNFRRRFATTTGVSPGRYQTTKLMDKACALMLAERMTNKELAERLNFCDEFHFSRTFKTVVGLTPTQFRSKMPRGFFLPQKKWRNMKRLRCVPEAKPD